MGESNLIFEEILVCPYTHQPVVFETNKFVSKEAAEEFPLVNGRFDFRLKRPKNYSVGFVVGKGLSTEGIDLRPIGMNPDADVDYSKISVPNHLSREVLSYFPKAKNADSYVLDLGCGTGLHKQVCEMAGYKYIGIDYYGSKSAAILADGHALPFKSNSIDLVISISVMEHVQFPWVMAQEVARVLKPGGRFIGTLSFIEPFHEVSYYHMSHFGVLNTLQIGGFTKIKVLSPNKGWEGFDAVSIMHYFSSLPWWLIKAITYPYMLLHKMWWKYAELTHRQHEHPFNSDYRLLASSGSFIFVVDK